MGYTAVIATDPAQVPEDYCTVEVIVTDENGEATQRVAWAPAETAIRTDHPDVLGVAGPNADQLLERASWVRIGAWQLHDSALYATVRREH